MKTIILTLSILIMTSQIILAYETLGYKWQGLHPELSYYINEEGSEDMEQSEQKEMLEFSYAAWNLAGSNLAFAYKGETDIKKVAQDKKNVIMFEEGNGWSLGKNVVAATFIFSQGASILDADIVFNGKDHEWASNKDVAYEDKGELTMGLFDYRHVLMHEIGHAFGLDHSATQKAVMWRVATPNNNSNWVMDPDDSEGINFLYPRTGGTGGNNRPPEIISEAVTEAVVGVKYEYPVVAVDPENDILKYRLISKTLNMKIDSLTGLIWWYPKFLDAGLHTISVEVKDVFGGRDVQTYKLQVGDLVVYTLDTVVQPTEFFYYNVYVTPMDGYNILSGNIELIYKLDELAIVDIDTLGTVLKGASYAKNIDKDTTKIAFAVPNAFEGGGSMFRLKMMVFPEACGKFIEMKIHTAFFNDGDPSANTNSGTIFARCPYTDIAVTGRVIYEANAVGVENAELELKRSDSTLGADMSNEDGFFSINKLPAMENDLYVLYTEKDSGDDRGALSAYDASLMLRYVVDINPLEDYDHQQVAADVNVNSLITAYDAALLLRYLVGYDDQTKISHWGFFDDSYEITTLLNSLHGLEIFAWMIGDVSGNWGEYDTLLRKEIMGIAANITYEDFKSVEFTNSEGNSSSYFKTTVSVETLTDIFAGEIEMKVDLNKYDVISVKPLAMLNGFTVVSNAADNKIKAAFANTNAFKGEGDLFEITLSPKSGVASSGILKTDISYIRFNEMKAQEVGIEKRNSSVSVVSANSISKIFPNPFNPLVNIEYALQSSRDIQISVFDIKGRMIKILDQGLKSAGNHRIQWKGKDSRNRTMASGVYVVQLRGKNFIKESKLYLLK